MNNKCKKTFGYKELGKFLAIVWLGVLTIVLIFVYLNSMSLDVWKDTAFPWLIGGGILSIIGIFAVQIDKRNR